MAPGTPASSAHHLLDRSHGPPLPSFPPRPPCLLRDEGLPACVNPVILPHITWATLVPADLLPTWVVGQTCNVSFFASAASLPPLCDLEYDTGRTMAFSLQHSSLAPVHRAWLVSAPPGRGWSRSTAKEAHTHSWTSMDRITVGVWLSARSWIMST